MMPANPLSECIRRIRTGPWTFVQLRGPELGDGDIDGEDVDLLGTREAIDALVEAALAWTKEGLCHLHVARRKPRKTSLALFSPDGRQRLLFDLWIRLPQIDDGRHSLTFAHCEPLLLASPDSVRRLPLDAEASLYLHHLSAKKKDLSVARYRSFLTDYGARCRKAGFSQLADGLLETEASGTISEAARETSHDILHHAFNFTRVDADADSGFLAWEGLLSPPRAGSAVSIMGCDGAGKTSLATKLVEQQGGFDRLFTGKHLYRKSYLYKAAVILLRPLTFQSREKFDELIAPACYLRACLGLRLKMAGWKDSQTLIDRNLIDFLYLDRKTDQPRFSCWKWLHRLFGKRIPVVHCVADFETIKSRKDEMTRDGHERYDSDMSATLSRRCPTDYLCFNNAGELTQSAEALGKILASLSNDEEN